MDRLSHRSSRGAVQRATLVVGYGWKPIICWINVFSYVTQKKPYSSLSNWNRAKNLGNSNHTRTKTLFIKHNNYLKNWDSCQEQVSFSKVIRLLSIKIVELF